VISINKLYIMGAKIKIIIGIVFLAILSGFNSKETIRQDMITASITYESLGSLNGTTNYQYEVTLTNNTSSKQTVDYVVYLKSGNVIKKSHRHSTILTPNETEVSTHEGNMSDADWELVNGCYVEGEVRK
jgi:hypothetical protein